MQGSGFTGLKDWQDYLSEPGFAGLTEFAMQRKNPVGDTWKSTLTVQSIQNSKFKIQNFLERDSPKGFIFITAGRDLRKTVTFRSLPARQDCTFKSCLAGSFICAQIPQVDDLRLRKSGFSSRFPKTSFPPDFNNKTTSVAQESHMPLPHYLIYTHIPFLQHTLSRMSVILRYIMHKTSPASNEVIRSYVSVIVRAASEVVLLLKSGENEVCPATNYVCLYTDYVTFMEGNSKF